MVNAQRLTKNASQIGSITSTFSHAELLVGDMLTNVLGSSYDTLIFEWSNFAKFIKISVHHSRFSPEDIVAVLPSGSLVEGSGASERFSD